MRAPPDAHDYDPVILDARPFCYAAFTSGTCEESEGVFRVAGTKFSCLMGGSVRVGAP